MSESEKQRVDDLVALFFALDPAKRVEFLRKLSEKYSKHGNDIRAQADKCELIHVMAIVGSLYTLCNNAEALAMHGKWNGV